MMRETRENVGSITIVLICDGKKTTTKSSCHQTGAPHVPLCRVSQTPFFYCGGRVPFHNCFMDIPNQSHTSEDLTTTINNRLFRINNKKARQKKLSEDCDKSIDIRTEFKLLHVRETTWTVKWRIGQRTSEGSLTKKEAVTSHLHADAHSCHQTSGARDETRPDQRSERPTKCRSSASERAKTREAFPFVGPRR